MVRRRIFKLIEVIPPSAAPAVVLCPAASPARARRRARRSPRSPSGRQVRLLYTSSDPFH